MSGFALLPPPQNLLRSWGKSLSQQTHIHTPALSQPSRWQGVGYLPPLLVSIPLSSPHKLPQCFPQAQPHCIQSHPSPDCFPRQPPLPRGETPQQPGHGSLGGRQGALGCMQGLQGLRVPCRGMESGAPREQGVGLGGLQEERTLRWRGTGSPHSRERCWGCGGLRGLGTGGA